MSFATVANIVTVFFCAAVLVQSIRMMRSLKAVKEGALTDVVGALDKSTAQAKVVLSELKAALNDCAGSARVMAEGKAMAEELGVMIGIANASAERLLEAAGAANRAPEGEGEPEAGLAEPEDEPVATLSDEELAAKATTTARAPRGRGRGRTKVAA